TGVRPSSGAASPGGDNALEYFQCLYGRTLLRPRTGALRLPLEADVTRYALSWRLLGAGPFFLLAVLRCRSRARFAQGAQGDSRAQFGQDLRNNIQLR